MAHYIGMSSRFVTAFYGIYNPETRLLRYSNAGHNLPRLKRCQDGSLHALTGGRGLPLGVLEETGYEEAHILLQPGDQIIFYTDGITEAQSVDGEFFGTDRLDRELSKCTLQAASLMNSLLYAVEEFSRGRPADDDRTMIVARVN
jgi:sigma-B regulation protein RsbU (phosphoserine phosphatase)